MNKQESGNFSFPRPIGISQTIERHQKRADKRAYKRRLPHGRLGGLGGPCGLGVFSRGAYRVCALIAMRQGANGTCDGCVALEDEVELKCAHVASARVSVGGVR